MNKMSQYIKFSPLLIILGIVIFLLPLIVVIVDAGEVGVQSTFGNVSDRVLRSGLNIKSPFTKVIRLSTRTEEYTMSEVADEGEVTGDDSIQALASDGATLWLDVTIFYRLKDTEAPKIYKELGLNFDEKIIRPEIRSKIREVVSRYPVNDIYSTKRGEIQSTIQTELKESLANRGIEVEDTLLRRVNLSQTLFASIELKLTAQQKAQQKEFEIEEAKKEAERRQVEAEGQREAQRIINESLSDQYLYYLYIQSLGENGNVTYVPTEGGVPLFKNVD